MSKLKFEIPDDNTPGYLRRQKKLVEFLECPDDSSRKLELLVDVLLDYVISPADLAEAEELLWEMSKSDYDNILERIQSQGEVPPNS